MRALLLAMLALAACKSNEPAKTAQPTDVVVVKPGAAPLRAVRYAVPKGAHTTVELATDWKATAGEIGNVLPTIVTTFDITCEDVDKNGGMHLHARVTDASAHEKADSGINPASLAPMLEPLKGYVLRVTLQPDGRVSPAAFEAPPVGSGSSGSSGSSEGSAAVVGEQLTALAASLQQLAIPLPTAPIGVGAEWKTTRTIDQGGMKLTSTTTLDVTSLDATTIGFSLTSDVKGADQTVTQSGIAVELEDVGGSATGKGTIDLAKGVTTGELHFDLHSQMTAAGSSTPMRAQTDITIH